jgi:hypothetical protein
MTKSFLLIFICFALETMAQEDLNFSGSVYNFTNSTPVPNSNIVIKKLNKKIVNGALLNERIFFKSTVSDSLGRFSIPLPKGEYVVEVTSMGYSKKSKFITFTNPLKIEFELHPMENQLADLEVVSQKAESAVSDVNSGLVKLNMVNVKKMPVIMGQADIIKTLTFQPGVSTVGEGAGGFNVRGGKVDQNLLLLDDINIYNSSHLLGFFSSINAEVVRSADLYKSGIPAQYGGRLSSIFDIKTKDRADSSTFNLGLGMISSSLLFQKNLFNEKLNVTVAGRLAYPNWIFGLFPKKYAGSKASFSDFNGVLNYKINQKNRLKLSIYNSFDLFKFPEDTSYCWINKGLSLGYFVQIKSYIFFNIKYINSNYEYGVNGLDPNYGFALRSNLADKELKSTLFYSLKRGSLELGLNGKKYELQPGKIDPTTKESSINSYKLPSLIAFESGLFSNLEWNLNRKMAISAGLKWSFFARIGPFSETQYQKVNGELIQQSIIERTSNELFSKYNGAEPRISVRQNINENTSIKVNYHRMRQYLHLISNTTAISPIDYWTLSNTYIPPQIADQWALGYYKNLKEKMYSGYLEIFYKNYLRLIEYKDGADLFLQTNLETQLVDATGKAYGIEFNLQKLKGRLTGNLSYTYSRSFAKTIENSGPGSINSGKAFPSLYDKPHNLSLQWDYFLGKGFSFTGNLVYQSGRPLTLPESQYTFKDNVLLNYEDRNLNRMPEFHRVDLALVKDSRRTKNQKKYHTLNFSIYNLYARRNPYSIFFKQYLSISKPYKLSVLGTAIPSIMLNLYW